MIINIGDLEFNTQKLALSYVRNLLIEIGESNNVKSISNDYYNKLYDICKLHDDDEKLLNIKDFVIKKSYFNKNVLVLYILKLDNSLMDNILYNKKV